ncbi:MAG TPA: hypothetical protein VFT42_04395 [Solirubrobacteraceae bacterium]|nr:hypothetical protein [Solirubrobacteraceae bacterium]
MIAPLAVMAVLLAAVAIIAPPGLPWRARRRAADALDDGDLPALEAEKEAKYREIRDAELDFRTGKLSREDHHALDRALRAEAIELLQRLDAARERETA